jgi:cyanobactin maturation PatA/PatG family protease
MMSVTPSGEARSGDRARVTAAPPRLEPRTAAAASRDPRASGIPVETEDPVSPAKKRLIYTLGTIGYDFVTESRRDTFKQLMPPVELRGTTVPANPYDPRQMSDHLARNPSDARSLVWTLHQEQTPIYVLKPVAPFGHQVYETLRLLLAGQVDASGGGASVERVSAPAERTERAIRLFSGQVVPVAKLGVPRGLYGWRVDDVIEDALAAAAPDLGSDEALRVRRALRDFLDRVYHDLKNPGDTSKDRALNFAATNAFQVTQALAQTVVEGRQLGTIEVVKSPVCRLYSDCWDVKLKFFDPDDDLRAKRVCRLTVDVSDLMPVSLGEVRTWMTRD